MDTNTQIVDGFSEPFKGVMTPEQYADWKKSALAKLGSMTTEVKQIEAVQSDEIIWPFGKAFKNLFTPKINRLLRTEIKDTIFPVINIARNISKRLEGVDTSAIRSAHISTSTVLYGTAATLYFDSSFTSTQLHELLNKLGMNLAKSSVSGTAATFAAYNWAEDVACGVDDQHYKLIMSKHFHAAVAKVIGITAYRRIISLPK